MVDAYYGARARRRRSVCRLALPALEDRRTIQNMLSQIVQHLAANTIDPHRATAMLAALRMASADLDRPQEW
jgi:Mg-chelatase subunit ChlI